MEKPPGAAGAPSGDTEAPSKWSRSKELVKRTAVKVGKEAYLLSGAANFREKIGEKAERIKNIPKAIRKRLPRWWEVAVPLGVGMGAGAAARWTARAVAGVGPGALAGAIGGAVGGTAVEAWKQKRIFKIEDVVAQFDAADSAEAKVAILAKAEELWKRKKLNGTREEQKEAFLKLWSHKVIDSIETEYDPRSFAAEELSNKDRLFAVLKIATNAEEDLRDVPLTAEIEARALIKKVKFERQDLDWKKIGMAAARGAIIGAIGGAIGSYLMDKLGLSGPAAAEVIHQELAEEIAAQPPAEIPDASVGASAGIGASGADQLGAEQVGAEQLGTEQAGLESPGAEPSGVGQSVEQVDTPTPLQDVIEEALSDTGVETADLSEAKEVVAAMVGSEKWGMDPETWQELKGRSVLEIDGATPEGELLLGRIEHLEVLLEAQDQETYQAIKAAVPADMPVENYMAMLLHHMPNLQTDQSAAELGMTILDHMREVEHIHSVGASDTIWEFLGRGLKIDNQMENIASEAQKTYLVDHIKDWLSEQSPERIKELGIPSGNIDQIQLGQELDLGDMFKDEEFLRVVAEGKEKALALSPQATESMGSATAEAPAPMPPAPSAPTAPTAAVEAPISSAPAEAPTLPTPPAPPAAVEAMPAAPVAETAPVTEPDPARQGFRVRGYHDVPPSTVQDIRSGSSLRIGGYVGEPPHVESDLRVGGYYDGTPQPDIIPPPPVAETIAADVPVPDGVAGTETVAPEAVHLEPGTQAFETEVDLRLENSLREIYGEVGSDSGEWHAWREYGAADVLRLPASEFPGSNGPKLYEYLHDLVEKTGLEPEVRNGQAESLEHFVVRAEAASLAKDLGVSVNDLDNIIPQDVEFAEAAQPENVSGDAAVSAAVEERATAAMAEDLRANFEQLFGTKDILNSDEWETFHDWKISAFFDPRSGFLFDGAEHLNKVKDALAEYILKLGQEMNVDPRSVEDGAKTLEEWLKAIFRKEAGQ